MKPSEYTAPTAKTLSPSAGAPIVVGPGPEFPAEFTTNIPLPAAISAAMVIIAVFPSSSEAS